MLIPLPQNLGILPKKLKSVGLRYLLILTALLANLLPPPLPRQQGVQFIVHPRSIFRQQETRIFRFPYSKMPAPLFRNDWEKLVKVSNPRQKLCGAYITDDDGCLFQPFDDFQDFGVVRKLGIIHSVSAAPVESRH